MAVRHRPDFDVYRKEYRKQSEADRGVGMGHRESFLWPYVNEEDLLKPRIFLLFLSSRGRHSPHNFAAADMRAVHIGLITQAITPVFLDDHVMLLRGRTNSQSYGQLMNWDEHPDAKLWTASRIELPPGEGLLILEIQDRILSFLLKCVQQILVDLSPQLLFNTAVQLEPPSSACELRTGLGSLAILTAEAAYRVPDQVDMGRIESLIAAKRDRVADHLWSLREDPGYFNHEICEAGEHRQERLKDSRGQAHPVFRQRREDIFWGRVLGNTLMSSCIQLETWSELQNQAEMVKRTYARYGPTLGMLEDLPADFMYALLKFRYYLSQAAQGPLNMLQISVVSSPQWRPYFERDRSTDPTDDHISIHLKPSVSLDNIQSDLLWLLQVLWEDAEKLYLLGMPNVVDELQRLLNSNTQAHNLISTHVASWIADLSIISECLRQINLYQPWASTFDYTMFEHKDKITKEFVEKTQTSACFVLAFRGGENLNTFARYGASNKINFNYPVNKRKTKENVTAMQLAENNLDKFWTRVDEIIAQQVGIPRSTAAGAFLATQRSLKRTADWTEPIKSETRTEQSSEAEIETPLSDLYLDLQQRTEQTLAPHGKSKQASTKS